MDLLYACVCGLLLYLLVQMIRLALADCDLTLQWYEKFGKSPRSLKGKIVWITGASSGIGEYIAYELAVAGCKLILSARREAELERVKKACIEKGSKSEEILVLPLDSVKFDTHHAAVETALKYFKTIDILINNAGRSQRADFYKTSLEVDREMFDLNVFGYLSLTKAVLPVMKAKKSGHIAVVSSIAGKMGLPNAATYTGTKFAVQGLFDSLRIEEAESNINVSSLCPGPVFSDLLQNCFTDTPNKLHGKKMSPTEKRMSTKRCAELCVVAIVNKVNECWISQHPALMMTYVNQYCPTLGTRILIQKGKEALLKVREGQ